MRTLLASRRRNPESAGARVWVAAMLAMAVLGLSISAGAAAQLTANERQASVGDAPEMPGLMAADVSGAMRRAKVRAAMRKVADWQLERVRGAYSQDWTFATLYVGMLAAAETLNDPRYRDYVKDVAEHYQWTLGPRTAHADDQAIGQSYLWLDGQQHTPEHLRAMQTQFDEVMQTPDDAQKPVWWWCDALFMAPPVWAGLAKATHDEKYVAYMDREWHVTADLLWDPQEHLFWRDASYLDKHERNGKKIFWSRGNGWVMGGLVRLLEALPAGDPRRAFYEEKFRQMAEKVRSIQGEDGLWRPGLLDAESYPHAEVSGSAFFVYALAWGVRHGMLEKKTYLPVVERGWKGLVAHIYADGRLGSIQPVGAAPGEYTPGASYVFGVGAYLLAGSEADALSH